MLSRPALLAAAALAAAVSASFPAAAARPADDVSVKAKVENADTAGPTVRVTVKNKGTNAREGVEVRVFAEHESGAELWSGTVDLLPGKSATVEAKVLLDGPTTVLVARASLPDASDPTPGDNAARVGLGLKGKAATLLVGRSIHLGDCAECHATADLQGVALPALLAGANAPETSPGYGPTDAKALLLFLKDPEGVVLPPELVPPEGGWPLYAGPVGELLQDRCGKCHGAGLAEARIRVDTHDKAASAARKCLSAVKRGTMPRGGKRFDADEIGLLQDWIHGGMR